MEFITDYKVENYILDTRWEDLPDEVKTRAKGCGLDLMTALILGSQGEQFRNGVRISKYMIPGDITVPGCRETFSFPGAAVALGHASNSFDIDDGHNMIKGHPGTSFVGAVMAAGLEKDISYREYLTTLVVCYDIAVRSGLSLQDYYGFLHSTGAYGAVSSAAGIGRIFGFTREQLNTAISMAEFHAPLTPVMISVEYPSMNKDGAPFGVLTGTFAALDTLAGETAKGYLLEMPAYKDLADSLGKRYEILNLYFKPYTCCRWAHQPIRASIELMQKEGFTWEDVEHVTVHTFDSASKLSKIVPKDTDEAQYNIAYPVAAAIVNGDLGYLQVCNANLGDERVLSVMKRLSFDVDPEMEAQFPAKRLAWVEFSLKDGRNMKTPVYAADGEASDHVDNAWLTAKFRRITAPFFTPEAQDSLLETMLEKEGLSLREVVAEVNRWLLKED